MTDVLAHIIARKRSEVAARLVDGPPPATPTRRSLRAALAQPGARFIMEIKQASPSGHRARHDIDSAARAYTGIADAISVLTDGPDFGGSLSDIAKVRAHFDGPILAKDFVVSRAQIAEARAAGADAVLLMLSVLSDDEVADFLSYARTLGMDALVEAHDAQELARAVRLDAPLIGINNRDLKTLSVDLAVTERLAASVPAKHLLVCESGIATHGDVRRLTSHVDAFLVGSSLMASPDIGFAARQLVRGAVKICGLTRAEDVKAVYQAGFTHAGFIDVTGSPRRIAIDEIGALAAKAASLALRPVLVAGDDNPASLAEAARALPLKAVQFHGTEAERHARLFADLAPEDIESWCAVPIGNAVPAPLADARVRPLFDTKAAGRSGGAGQPFDWSLVADHPAIICAFVAGGIGPGNAARAAMLGAYGLDSSSAVEAAPGIKDHLKLNALADALRPACRGEQ